MKICSKCKIEKPKTEFHKRADRPSGVHSKCKGCALWAQKLIRNTEEYRQYDRERAREYRKTQKGKEISDRHVQSMKTRGIAKVHNLFKRAVRDGKIIKKPCEVCGKVKSEGHHDDYSKPYDVIWLCHLHHKKRHKEVIIKGA